MIIALTMPQFGESITQARIVHWLRKEGETTKELEPLAEMETEKAVFSYECPFRGKLSKILVADDSEAAVGTEIAHFDVTEEDGRKYLSLGIGRKVGEGSGATAAVPVVSPLIRSLAKEHGLSIDEVGRIAGSGPGGRVTKEDFLAHIALQTSILPPAREGVRIIQLAPVRARIADNMILSKTKIPHAGCGLEVDLSLIERWRSEQKKPPPYLPFMAVAVLKALKRHPILNSSWKEGGGRRWIEQYDFVHLGVAVASGKGLLVPVIRNAEKLSLSEVGREIERLIDAGRKGVLGVQDLTGATFTINNSGALGAVRSAQIIPHPQAAVLATNRIVRRPWVAGDKIEVHPIMELDLAFDHRIIDGDEAVRFLVTLKDQLEGLKN